MTAPSSSPRRPAPRITLGAVVSFLLFALLGGAVGALSARGLLVGSSELVLTRPEKVALLMMSVLILPLLVLWHELGHIAGGKVGGFRPMLLVVGPVRWQKTGGRWTMSVNRNAAMMGGLAACTPERSHDLVRRTAAMIAGGPLASVLGGGIGVGVWAALPPLGATSAFAAVAGYAALAVFGFGNLFLGIASLTPTRAGGFYSDGARLLRMWRGGPEMDREVAILALTGSTIGGVRPRDWDPEVVRRSIGDADGTLFHVMGLQFAFGHAQDRGAVDEARGYVRALLEAEDAMPPLIRPALRLGVVPFTMLRDGDAARVRALMQGATGGLLIDRHIRHLAQAAAAWADGDAARTAVELDLAEAELPRAIDRGAALAAADRVAELRALLRGVAVRETSPVPS